MTFLFQIGFEIALNLNKFEGALIERVIVLKNAIDGPYSLCDNALEESMDAYVLSSTICKLLDRQGSFA